MTAARAADGAVDADSRRSSALMVDTEAVAANDAARLFVKEATRPTWAEAATAAAIARVACIAVAAADSTLDVNAFPADRATDDTIESDAKTARRNVRINVSEVVAKTAAAIGRAMRLATEAAAETLAAMLLLALLFASAVLTITANTARA